MTELEFKYKLIDLYGSLKKHAYRLIGNREVAMDLVQETYLKALKNRDKFSLDSNLKAWTFTIMKNTFINEYRRKFHQNIYHSRNYESCLINDSKIVGFEDPSSVYCTSELVNNIEQLEERFRLPLKLHISGYKYKEISDELNLNIGTVKSRIFFARKQMMEKMNR